MNILNMWRSQLVCYTYTKSTVWRGPGLKRSSVKYLQKQNNEGLSKVLLHDITKQILPTT